MRPRELLEEELAATEAWFLKCKARFINDLSERQYRAWCRCAGRM